MSKYQERNVFPAAFSGDKIHDSVVVTDDVTIFNWTGTNITSMTPTRVDLATAGTATGAITFSATDATAAANMQTAIRALGGIYATATVVAGATADNMVITVYGGYDITWAQAGGVGTFTETGAAGSDTAVAGAVVYTKQIPIGKFAEVKKILVKNFNENALSVDIKDADAKSVFVATLDTSTAAADVPYVRLLTADGVAGEDGAAAANSSGGVFRGPLTCILTSNAPYQATAAQPVPKVGASLTTYVPRLTLTVAPEQGRAISRILKRTTGARTTLTGTLDLGAPVANIKRIRLLASSDTTVAPTLTDADGLVVYTKTSTDYTTAVLEQLSHEGVDQAGNALADTLDVIARGPLTLSGSGLGAGTFTVEVTVEV